MAGYSCQTCVFVLEIHLFYQHDTLRRCVCVLPSPCFPSDSASANPSPPPAPARPPGRWGPAGGLPAGRCWLPGSPVTEVGTQRSNIKIRRISNHITTQMGRFTAPVNPCEPALVCRRPSCCSAPAAEPSHSPLWPLQSDSVSGSKWLWRAAKTRNYLCHSGWRIWQQFTLFPHSEAEYFRVRTRNLRKCGQQEHTCKRKLMQNINI